MKNMTLFLFHLIQSIIYITNEDLFKAFSVVKNHLKEGGLFLLDCFNPNIQYIVEGEKEQKEIADIYNQMTEEKS
jgi:hypothetical protein